MDGGIVKNNETPTFVGFIYHNQQNGNVRKGILEKGVRLSIV
jgi:hypothetical protein